MADWVCTPCADGIPHNFAHGNSGYTYHSCRCDLCEAGYRDKRERHREAARQKRQGDPEAARQVSREYYRLNKKQILKKNREHRRAHREKYLQDQRARTALMSKEDRERRRAQNRDYHERNSGYIADRRSKYCERLKRIPAPRNGSRWTAAEDSIVLRDEVSIIEQAYMLGRSYRAVAARRFLLDNPEGAAELRRRARAKFVPKGPRTTCRSGQHEYTEFNVYYDRKGIRYCRACRDEYRRDHRQELAERQRSRTREIVESLPAPTRFYTPWTPAEDAIIARDDLDCAEQARMLSRSLSSVRNRRIKVRRGNVSYDRRPLAPSCGKGHAYTPENTRQTSRGRACLTCAAESSRRSQARIKEKRAAARREQEAVTAGYLTTEQVAEACGWWTRSVTKACARGDLRAWQLTDSKRSPYLIAPEDARAFIEKRRAIAEAARQSPKGSPGPRDGTPWTAAEDAIIARDDLTCIEQSHMLGRSYWSIKNRRSALRKQAA